MVINYDRNPARSTDEKLESLMQSVQLALNEVSTELENIKKVLAEMQKTLDSI